MDLILPLKIAFRALRVNMMRSFLTMLGIMIGIGAVIVMVAVGSGASKQIADQIATMGSNLILVLPGSTTSGGIRAGGGSAPTLTYDDVKAIRNECPSVSLAAPSVRGTAQVIYGNMNWSTVIQGATPDMLWIREWRTVRGREMTQSDSDTAQKVCLLGNTVAETLFGDEDPTGKQVRIKGVPFTVIGVLEVKGRSPQGSDQDDVIYVPITTAQRKLFGSPIPNTVGVILLQARDQSLLPQAEKEVSALLDQRHHVGPTRVRDFTVRNLTEILAVSQQSSQVMSMLLGAVASISLIVGGIGIMNIMLVSVTERTREIGIRMAIGAREGDILLQFLAEAVLLTLLGGIIGILMGVGSALIISALFDWPTLISANAIGIAVAFSSAIGIFFGYYPARKAAQLNPIDALRYE
ncbi:MAG: multidrug ABC transporter substrate-binding protein [Deltaproteobacteria bacterium HGW-Deltaproteobacteria-8]|jgi:putative ABC transport system permease protein|nr:MAG: multidrug ABC transporter substrate-binding protein [Deltaproteobacteria bacterium HGW-Deltaproteobacteria-8]